MNHVTSPMNLSTNIKRFSVDWRKMWQVAIASMSFQFSSYVFDEAFSEDSIIIFFA